MFNPEPLPPESPAWYMTPGWFGLPLWALLALGVLVVVVFLFGRPIFIVRQQYAYLIERLGRFRAVKHAGLRVMIPFVDRIREKVGLFLYPLAVKVDTKTKDNVFVKVEVAVQLRVDGSRDDRIADSWYKLEDADNQIKSFVSSQIRAILPTLLLDDAFADISAITERVQRELSERLADYGYIIEDVLITEIKPPSEVVTAMNAINAARRNVEVTQLEGDAEVIRATKHGEGIAAQRTAIANGLAASLRVIAEAGAAEAQQVLLASMHYEALVAAAQGPATTILMPTGAEAASGLISSLVAASKASGE